ncbi:unnamed protein product [Tilletia laevis]|uniref:C2 NT-type domain-containing protein n=4 Tax=Tilletia TaxID=13289 RepID=A0A8X7N109_9BASI|nr:hypothetical protein CF336_g7145 [Tilletia laevis]KAE8186084.1 hypothetical protein CF328_g7343 [Tilletia controversa]KAE8247791.1 hypothetical protein A4X03_0g6954 [Tilletia caries]KAE8187168.1 hypothetical protein CF335_g7249 [Tilletia laevis]KAE8254975.1 hypothetical protein A4X06_0g644 [Tilletia controversa]
MTSVLLPPLLRGDEGDGGEVDVERTVLMASLLNPFGFGQKHAYFYVRLTIHELKNVPLITGEFQVKWKFKGSHPIADVPGINITALQQPQVASSGASLISNGGGGGGGAGDAGGSSSTTTTTTTATATSPATAKNKSGATSAPSSHPASADQSQVTSVNASAVDLSASATTSTSNFSTASSQQLSQEEKQSRPQQGEQPPRQEKHPRHHQQQTQQQPSKRSRVAWHQPRPEARGFTESITVKDHTVRWQRRVEVGLKMNVERAPTNSSGNHANSKSANLAVASSSLGSTSYRDRADDSRSLKGSISGTALDSHHDHDRHEEMWGKLGRCEVKLTVKQQVNTDSKTSHTMAPPDLGYVNLNLAEFAPYSSPAQANQHHYDHHHHHHHHLSHHHHHHHSNHHHHREIDPKQTLFRSETRRFLLSESRTNASLKITVEIVHVGGSREYIVPTLKDGIIIASSDQSLSDYPLLPFMSSARDDHSSGSGTVLARDTKDRKEVEAVQSKGSSGDSSVDSTVQYNNSTVTKGYAHSIGGEPYRERASSSVSSLDTRSARSVNLAGSSAEYAALGVPSRASKALRSGPNYPFSFSGSRNVSGHSRIPSSNLKNPQAAREQKAKQRLTAERKEIGIGEGTELSPDEIVRDLFRPEPKHVVLLPPPSPDPGEKQADAVEYLQVATGAQPQRSGESSARTSFDNRSLGSNLPPGLARRPSSSSYSSRSTGGSERPSMQISVRGGGGDDGASISSRSVQTLSTVGEFADRSPVLRSSMKRTDSGTTLADLSVTSEPGDRRRRNSAASIVKDEKPASSSSSSSTFKKGHARTSSATSTNTMRSIMSTKGLASVLMKRQNSHSSSSKRKDPTAVITRQTGPQLAPGLLSAARSTFNRSTGDLSVLVPGGRPTSTKGPSIRFAPTAPSGHLPPVPAPISPTSTESLSGSIPGSVEVSARPSLDIVPTSSRVPGTETSSRPNLDGLALNPPIVVRTSTSSSGHAAPVHTPESPVSELPFPASLEQNEMDATAAAAVATATVLASQSSPKSNKGSKQQQQQQGPGGSPQPGKKSKWPLAGADKSKWRGAGWRADLDVPNLDQGVYTRSNWPATLLSTSALASADPSDPFKMVVQQGIPPKVRGAGSLPGSMAIFRIDPKVSSPPEDVLGSPRSGAAPNLISLASESVLLNTPAGLADDLAASDPLCRPHSKNKPGKLAVPATHFSTSGSSSGSASVASSECDDDDFDDQDDRTDDNDDDDDDDEERCYEDARQSMMTDRDMHTVLGV